MEYKLSKSYKFFNNLKIVNATTLGAVSATLVDVVHLRLGDAGAASARAYRRPAAFGLEFVIGPHKHLSLFKWHGSSLVGVMLLRSPRNRRSTFLLAGFPAAIYTIAHAVVHWRSHIFKSFLLLNSYFDVITLGATAEQVPTNKETNEDSHNTAKINFNTSYFHFYTYFTDKKLNMGE